MPRRRQTGWDQGLGKPGGECPVLCLVELSLEAEGAGNPGMPMGADKKPPRKACSLYAKDPGKGSLAKEKTFRQ